MTQTEPTTRHDAALLRRHLLVETFLHDVLQVPADRVDACAELVETGMSERVVELIAGALGHPERDPHGQPIPPRSEGHPPSLRPLSATSGGERFRVLDVRDLDALRRLAERGIDRGAILEVVQEGADRGSRCVRLRGQLRILRPDLVDAVHGEVIGSRTASRREPVSC